jgi:serine/threonine protein kinase
MEPLPGYRLMGPLGRGGFGEVWKCEAPGGLLKAIKFVHGEDGPGLARIELEAVQRIKSIRHPFILSLERVEVVDGVLLVVMELADKSLLDVLADCRALGMPGVPRNELLSLLLEAAEALDWMNFVHLLQHLDVKPHNLFVVSNHLKVADFGLVNRVPEAGAPAFASGGVTPLYASPERLRGGVSRQSDQYSLAVVYQQLATGTVPFWSSNPQQLILKHLGGQPDLQPLPPADQAVVARALAKDPEQRFPSCLAFIQALVRGPDAVPRSGAAPVLSAAPTPPSAATPTPPASSEPTRLEPRILASGEATRVVDSSRAAPPPAAATQIAFLWGYELVERLGQGPLGDLWLAHDADGRPYRALSLYAAADDGLLRRLEALDHPQLPPTRVVRGPGGQLVVLTEPFEETLGDRFERCRAAGQPGVPRDELLCFLRSAAETLDDLRRELGLSHLALNPRNLMVEHDQLWVTEFGLAALVGAPGADRPTPLYPRYAALELFDGQASDSSDQYSLALIYAEMLSGFHPRSRVGSGMHRRPGTGRPTPPRGPVKIDLDLLPPHDRQVLARALDPEPERRWESCTAMVRALEGTETPRGRRDLPPVAFVSALVDRSEPPAGEPPPVERIVADLASESVLPLAGGPSDPSGLPASGPAFEIRYPIRLVPGVTGLKVHGFRKHWNGRVLHEDDHLYLFHL